MADGTGWQLYDEQSGMGSCGLRYCSRLSRRARLLSQRATRGWALLCARGCGIAQCERLDHCGLVQCRNARMCSSWNARTAMDYADSRDHRRTAQADSAPLETTGLSSTRGKYGTVEAA